MICFSSYEPKSYKCCWMYEQINGKRREIEKEKMPFTEDPAVPPVFLPSVSNCHSLQKIH